MLRNIPRDVTDERFRTAVVLGIVSIPFTAGVNWILTPDITEATPLVIACVMSGYLYGSGSVNVARAGLITGVIGAIPIVVWESWTTLSEWWRNPILIDAVGNSAMMAAVSIGVVLLTVIVMFLLISIIGMVGGIIGGWINRWIDSARLIGSKT